MPVDQDWTAVYPVAAPFRPNSVPLPLRMGYPVKGGVPPEKKGNLELIKVKTHHLQPKTKASGYIFNTPGCFPTGNQNKNAVTTMSK